MLSFPRGAQDKEEARWSPLPLPSTPGQGPASAQCPEECLELWQQLPLALPRPRAGIAAGTNVPCVARPCGRAPPPSLQRRAHPRATIHSLEALTSLHTAGSRCPAPSPEPVLPAGTDPSRSRARPDGQCQAGTEPELPKQQRCSLPYCPGTGCRFPAGHFRGAASSWKHFRGIPCETGTALAREAHETSFQGCRTAPWSPNKQTHFGSLCCTAQLHRRQHTAGLTGADRMIANTNQL